VGGTSSPPVTAEQANPTSRSSAVKKKTGVKGFIFSPHKWMPPSIACDCGNAIIFSRLPGEDIHRIKLPKQSFRKLYLKREMFAITVR
jgi:hypothetical protein